MNHKRLMQIIEAYGTRAEQWPEEERDAAVEQLRHDPRARQLLNSLSIIDIALDSSDATVIPNLRDKILSNLPQRLWIDRCLEWLLPSVDELLAYFWRPVLAASLPLITGFLLGGSLFTAEVTESWEDEIVLIALDETRLGEVNE